MNYIFNEKLIQGNELLLYIYILSMLIIIVLTIIFVKKELGNKNDNK